MQSSHETEQAAGGASEQPTTTYSDAKLLLEELPIVMRKHRIWDNEFVRLTSVSSTVEEFTLLLRSPIGWTKD